MYNVVLSRDADICNQSLRSSLEGGNRFRLCGRDGRLNPSSTGFTDLPTQFPQRIHVARVNREFMGRGSLWRAIWERPPLKGTGRRMQNIVWVGTW